MMRALEVESKIKAGWIDCFKPEGKQLYRTLLGMTLQMFQQLTGANYFFYVSYTGGHGMQAITDSPACIVWCNDLPIGWHSGLVCDSDHPWCC